MTRLELPEGESDLRVFHNRLRILMGIDKHELVDAGVLSIDSIQAWEAFCNNPWRWFIACSDEQNKKLWSIIQKREKRT